MMHQAQTHVARNRRALLVAMALCGARALVRPLDAAAQALAPPHRVDIHHHLFPPEYRKALAAEGTTLFPWSLEQSIEAMDAGGVARAYLSLSPPGVWLGESADLQQGRRLSRLVNEYGARVARDHPGRFGLFAALPLPDIDGSLLEIAYAFDTLRADGVGVFTSYGNRYLGDDSFVPIWRELDRRGAVVYTHPTTPACCGSLGDHVGPVVVEWSTDTTRTAASLLFSGTAARYSAIRWILSHGGGSTPFLLSRFRVQEAALEGRRREELLPRGLLYELRKFHYDTAQANHAGALAALLRMVPASQILFGTDYPYRPVEETVSGLAAFGFPDTDLDAIERDNAVRLLFR